MTDPTREAVQEAERLRERGRQAIQQAQQSGRTISRFGTQHPPIHEPMVPGDPQRLVNGVVYVIDDDVRVRQALCRLLDCVDLFVEAFPSAEAFLEHPLPEPPACLVLDVHLGNGRSGLELQAHLGAWQQMIPIIFITGSGSVPASVKAMKAGALDCLEKPIDPEAFLECVRNALALSRQQAQVGGRAQDHPDTPGAPDASRATDLLADGARRIVQP